jgi:hypothetical protein
MSYGPMPAELEQGFWQVLSDEQYPEEHYELLEQ